MFEEFTMVEDHARYLCKQAPGGTEFKVIDDREVHVTTLSPRIRSRNLIRFTVNRVANEVKKDLGNRMPERTFSLLIRSEFLPET